MFCLSGVSTWPPYLSISLGARAHRPDSSLQRKSHLAQKHTPALATGHTANLYPQPRLRQTVPFASMLQWYLEELSARPCAQSVQLHASAHGSQALQAWRLAGVVRGKPGIMKVGRRAFQGARQGKQAQAATIETERCHPCTLAFSSLAHVDVPEVSAFNDAHTAGRLRAAIRSP